LASHYWNAIIIHFNSYVGHKFNGKKHFILLDPLKKMYILIFRVDCNVTCIMYDVSVLEFLAPTKTSKYKHYLKYFKR